MPAVIVGWLVRYFTNAASVSSADGGGASDDAPPLLCSHLKSLE
jgi:hypothetical protein